MCERFFSHWPAFCVALCKKLQADPSAGAQARREDAYLWSCVYHSDVSDARMPWPLLVPVLFAAKKAGFVWNHDFG